jgi:hypothetical protein
VIDALVALLELGFGAALIVAAFSRIDRGAE